MKNQHPHLAIEKLPPFSAKNHFRRGLPSLRRGRGQPSPPVGIVGDSQAPRYVSGDGLPVANGKVSVLTHGIGPTKAHMVKYQ